MIKVYETINDARLVTTVGSGAEEREIVFEGGATFPSWKAGIFTTDNNNLQQLVENSKSFGVSYRLREREITHEQENSDSASLIDIPQVTNKQKAIEWIRINLGISFTPATSAIVIKQAVEERGYTFCEWLKRLGV